jgi:hypothetical protein
LTRRNAALAAYIAFWFALVPLAILNGLLRERSYGRRVSELRAHQISTLTGMLLTGLAVWAFATVVPLSDSAVALRVGLIWVAMTIAFEFGFGHWVAGHRWARLLGDYNLLAGRVWLVYLVWIGLLPYLVHRLAHVG